VEFRRLNPGSGVFRCRSGEGPFKIKRPSGPKLTREGLGLSHPDHDYDVRTDGDEVWLMDGDRSVGYAQGDSTDWHLLLDDQAYGLEQPKAGSNNTALMREGVRVGEIEGHGLPLRRLNTAIRADLTYEQKAFVVMIALLGWRESDRSLLGSTPLS
jgi:hypothetical protein